MHCPQKALVAFDSRTGSTAAMAEMIGRVLAEGIPHVEIRPIQAVQALTEYDAVVLGSPIRAGRLTRETLRFVDKHRAELREKRVACFVSGMTLADDSMQRLDAASVCLDPVRMRLDLVDTAFFAGKMDYAMLGFFTRMIVKRLMKTPEGDYRDWEAIKLWGRGLLAKL
ncbi:MAG TPA: flavodoxin domain-containing protein [Holophaga sp.]|nr:flavodoxin domain-containing protein [Holophaga sp.]